MSDPATVHSRSESNARARGRRWLGAAVALGLLLVAAIVAWAGWSYWNNRPLNRAQRAYSRGAWNEAATQAIQALKDNPSDREATALLARSQARLGKNSLARGLYRQLDPDRLRAEDYFLVGRGLIAEGELEQGRYGLERALALEPHHGEALREIIALDRKSDGLEVAAARATTLAATPGWEARGLVLLGLVRQALGDPGAAAEAFRKALERDPELRGCDESNAEQTRLQLARCLLQTGRPSDARAELMVLEARGQSTAVVSWLQSRAALQEHDLEGAKSALAQAGDSGSDHPEAFEPAPYVGTARCGECHAARVRAPRASRHAKTFRTRGDLDNLPVPAQPLLDPGDSHVVHRLTRQGRDLRFETHSPQGDLQALVEFVMGSGDRAYTLVGRDTQGNWRELRMSYYGAVADWDRTTGQLVHPPSSEDFLGPIQLGDTVRRCLGCHTTRGKLAPEPASGDAKASPERGFSCERCHGPAGNHLAAADVGFADPAIGRPRLAAPARVDALCAQCHSAAGRGVTVDNPNLARFQSSSLPLSRCTTASREPLSCLLCHDPHRDAETSASFYEGKCLRCHSPASSANKAAHPAEPDSPPSSARIVCPVNPARDCISCHMPQRVTGVPHTTFTDHYIRVPPEKQQPGPR